MSTITTHILDTALGQPAKDVQITLSSQSADGWQQLAIGNTDGQGRLTSLTPEPLSPGHYQLTAETGRYFAATGRPSLFLVAQIDFVINEVGQHFHLPFLITPNAWSVYRGS